jgi:hypothetical protein
MGELDGITWIMDREAFRFLFQIIDDIFQFARSGIMSYTKAFNILSFLNNETDYAPWAAAIAGINWLTNRVTGTPLEPRLNVRIFIKKSSSYPYPTKWGRYNIFFHHVVIKIRQLFLRPAACLTSTLLTC